jgi:thioredoxin 1
MAIVELTTENIEPALTSGGLVLGKVDTQAQPELAAAFGISSIPTLMVICDRVVLYAQPGTLPEQALAQLVAKAREIDMDEVRRNLATPAAS